MAYLLFGEPQETYKVVILAKEYDLQQASILKHYINPIIEQSNGELSKDDFVAFSVDYVNGKAPVTKVIKPCLEELREYIKESEAEKLLIISGDYFKALTKSTKVTTAYGTPVKAVYEGYEHLDCYVTASYKTLFADPRNQDKIDLVNSSLTHALLGKKDYFLDKVKVALYPKAKEDIVSVLNRIKDCPMLASDIEGYDLKHVKSRIATISFAWSTTEGCAFNVDMHTTPQESTYIRSVLVQFFEYRYKKGLPIIWHGSNFDIRALVFELYMKRDLTNVEALLRGLEVFTKTFHDTKLIAYLALNSTARNNLGLKNLALPYLGDYGLDDEDFTDISALDPEEVLEYNLKDTIGTFYVFEKYFKLMEEEGQLDLYNNLFIPSMTNILQMGLHGMPIDLDEVAKLKAELTTEYNRCISSLNSNTYGKLMRKLRCIDKFYHANNTWKTKREPLDYFYNLNHKDVNVNYNSGNQIAKLLYDFCCLPVIDLTKTKAPATGVKTLKKLVNYAYNEEIKEFIELLIDLSAVSKILDAFIPAFEDAYVCPKTGQAYLFAYFNLGSVVSGRLSCSGPNLQQLPSNSKYAKAVKRCFKAPDGWLFVGYDFDSLEDYVSALTTKDPNKLKVYTDGYDGHSLRASTYYADKIVMIKPDFDFTTPEGVNQLKDEKTYGLIRQDSKPITFALTYQGTWLTLVTNLNMPEDEAKATEERFKELYKVSVEFIKKEIKKASEVGYATVAFGLKVRTPMLSKTLYGSSKMPRAAQKEARTVGNAMGQSYGLLNNRACVEIQQKTLASKYRLDILPAMQIHDAGYFIIRKDIEVLAFFNRIVQEAVTWQELPELQHDTVKIGGALDLFYPDWTAPITLPKTEYDPDKLKVFVNTEIRKRANEANK